MTILDQIVDRRRRRIAAAGHGQGAALPSTRRVPPVPFGMDPGVICEVKRRSPSKGVIAEGLDAVAQASIYVRAGATSISVLTEEEYFGGSLLDLIAVKQAHPEAAVLRKDFLLDEEDIVVSFRAGADAVLLIASILDAGTIARLHRSAVELGMAALVEVHDADDLAKVRPIEPPLIGINSRDLETFTVDPLTPVRLRGEIDWDAKTVYESGIRFAEDARFAGSNGFNCILVGESAVRNPEIIPRLINGLGSGRADGRQPFWTRLYGGGIKPGPLVKVCGLTTPRDVAAADESGADLLGFVFAESPRRADPAFVRTAGETKALKVGVVVTGGPVRSIPDEVSALLADGLLDAVQFHGDESPEECAALAFPYYKAVRLRDAAAAEAVKGYRCPRVLVDAYSGGASGGTGKLIDPGLLENTAETRPLWLAGGLTAGNVGEIVRRWRPELVDASSGLEESPGVKDRTAVRNFIRNAKSAGEQ